MDDQEKKLIRIDPLKIQQKLYELYPANSSVRRTVIAEAKAKELTHLSSLMQNEPVQIAKSSIQQNKKLIVLSSLLGFGFLLGSAFLFTYSFVFAKTLVETFLSAYVAGSFLFHAVSYFRDLFYLKEATDAFVSSIEKIQKRISDLKQ